MTKIRMPSPTKNPPKTRALTGEGNEAMVRRENERKHVSLVTLM